MESVNLDMEDLFDAVPAEDETEQLLSTVAEFDDEAEEAPMRSGDGDGDGDDGEEYCSKYIIIIYEFSMIH